MTDTLQKKPRFDPTVNLGHLITFAGLCVAAFGAYYGAKAELSAIAMSQMAIERRMSIVEQQLEKLSQILVVSARQEERATAIERRLDRLEQQLHRPVYPGSSANPAGK